MCVYVRVCASVRACVCACVEAPCQGVCVTVRACLSLAAPPTRAVQQMESEALHKNSKRSYAEFNKLLSLAHSEGFLVHPDPFKSQRTVQEVRAGAECNLAESCPLLTRVPSSFPSVQLTQSREMEKVAESVWRKLYNRHAGITELNTKSMRVREGVAVVLS